METVKHTPGPLIVVDGGCQSVRGFLAIVRDFGDGTTSVPTAYVARQDDAALYAAAPESHEANREAADFLVSYFGPVASDDPEGWSDQDARAVYEKLIAAVAKAEA
ncbi:MAG: hypothetical protein JWQ97_973 [Phenylobacterium sp.]|nr:hypothetical protein [Phenylobacterium sp.]